MVRQLLIFSLVLTAIALFTMTSTPVSAAPRSVSVTPLYTAPGLGANGTAFKNDNTLVIASGASDPKKMKVAAISNITATLSGVTNTTDIAKSVAIIGNTAYVAVFQGGMQVFDVAGAPALITSTTSVGTTYSIVADNNTLYLAGNKGLCKITLPNINTPTCQSTNPITDGRTVVLSPDKTKVYLGTAGGTGKGLFIFDSTTLTQLGSWSLPGATIASSIAVSPDGKVVYLSAGINGTHILDVLDPTNISQATTITGFTAGSGITDNVLLLAGNNSGIRAYDVTTPLSPTFLLQTPLDSTLTPANCLTVGPGGTIVIGNANGLAVYHFEKTATSVHISSFTAHSESWFDRLLALLH